MNLQLPLRRNLLFILLGMVALAGVTPGEANDSLNWRKEKPSVDADILTWDTVRVLERIAEATGTKAREQRHALCKETWEGIAKSN